MSKELLDTLPLEEVKKRTVLQQQVSTGTHASNRTPDYLFSLRRSRRLQRLKSLGASMKNEQIRMRRAVREQQLQVTAPSRSSKRLLLVFASDASQVFVPQALVERQNKDLSELLWKRGESERALRTQQVASCAWRYYTECVMFDGAAMMLARAGDRYACNIPHIAHTISRKSFSSGCEPFMAAPTAQLSKATDANARHAAVR